MDKIKKPFFFIAISCWILSLMAHVIALFDINIEAVFPAIWGLHAGIFIVWIPSIISLFEREELKKARAERKRLGPIKMFNIFFKYTPPWLKGIVIFGFFYAIINFMLFMESQPGGPSIIDGKHVLSNHGNILKEITEEEYNHYQANEVRGFSGHWLLFYGVAAGILYPFGVQNSGSKEE